MSRDEKLYWENQKKRRSEKEDKRNFNGEIPLGKWECVTESINRRGIAGM